MISASKYLVPGRSRQLADDYARSKSKWSNRKLGWGWLAAPFVSARRRSSLLQWVVGWKPTARTKCAYGTRKPDYDLQRIPPDGASAAFV